jgi:hypothetical protein
MRLAADLHGHHLTDMQEAVGGGVEVVVIGEGDRAGRAGAQAEVGVGAGPVREAEWSTVFGSVGPVGWSVGSVLGSIVAVGVPVPEGGAGAGWAHAAPVTRTAAAVAASVTLRRVSIVSRSSKVLSSPSRTRATGWAFRPGNWEDGRNVSRR